MKLTTECHPPPSPLHLISSPLSAPVIGNGCVFVVVVVFILHYMWLYQNPIMQHNFAHLKFLPKWYNVVHILFYLFSPSTLFSTFIQVDVYIYVCVYVCVCVYIYIV